METRICNSRRPRNMARIILLCAATDDLPPIALGTAVSSTSETRSSASSAPQLTPVEKIKIKSTTDLPHRKVRSQSRVPVGATVVRILNQI